MNILNYISCNIAVGNLFLSHIVEVHHNIIERYRTFLYDNGNYNSVILIVFFLFINLQGLCQLIFANN